MHLQLGIFITHWLYVCKYLLLLLCVQKNFSDKLALFWEARLFLHFYDTQDKSAVRFCHQVAAWAPDRFGNFYIVKSYRNANNSVTTDARVKISTDLESLEF